MTEPEIETAIKVLVERMDAARRDGAERKMIVRQLIGLRDRLELLSGDYTNHSLLSC